MRDDLERLSRDINLHLPHETSQMLLSLLDRRGTLGTCDECANRYVGHVLGSRTMQGPVARAVRVLREAQETEVRPAMPVLKRTLIVEPPEIDVSGMPETMSVLKADYAEMQRARKLIPLMEQAIKDLMVAVETARRAMLEAYFDRNPVPQRGDKEL